MFPANINAAIAPMYKANIAPMYSWFVITIIEQTAYTITADTMRYTGVFFVPKSHASKRPRAKKTISDATMDADCLNANHLDINSIATFIIQSSSYAKNFRSRGTEVFNLQIKELPLPSRRVR